VLLDGAPRLGAKILVSGGARCNVTNRVVTERDFAGGSRNVVRRVLHAFPAEAAAEFFREMGVALHEEPGGKLFPDSNRARTVLQALLDEAGRRGVDVRPGCRVRRVTRTGAGFLLETTAGPLEAARVILATGGLSLPKTGSDGVGYTIAETLGHSLVPRIPALVPLLLEDDFHARLAGVAHESELTVRVPGERPVVRRGPLLWTHFGISGPVALDVSRFWLRGGEAALLTASFLPGRDFETVEATLLSQAAASPRTRTKSALGAWLPASMAALCPEHLGISSDTPLGRLTRDDRRKLIRNLLEWPLPVRGSRGYDFAEVTAGGVPLEEVDPATMASRRCPGLFLVGEILDVDGRIGGFNFQWAWSTAHVAARGLAASR
jgi:predicted Rossmann fold flavoprotein